MLTGTTPFIFQQTLIQQALSNWMVAWYRRVCPLYVAYLHETLYASHMNVIMETAAQRKAPTSLMTILSFLGIKNSFTVRVNIPSGWNTYTTSIKEEFKFCVKCTRQFFCSIFFSFLGFIFVVVLVVCN